MRSLALLAQAADGRWFMDVWRLLNNKEQQRTKGVEALVWRQERQPTQPSETLDTRPFDQQQGVFRLRQNDGRTRVFHRGHDGHINVSKR